MNFFDAIKTCLSKYVTFSGRASRSEYWYFALFATLIGIISIPLDIAIFPNDDWGPIGTMIAIAVFLPEIAVGARRLHDVNRSGWWQLIALTVIGIIPLLYWLIKKSDVGDNNHGSNPLMNL